MKNSICLLLLLLLSYSQTYSQNIKTGFIYGFSQAQLRNENGNLSEHEWKYTVGIPIQIEIIKDLYISTRFSYERKGTVDYSREVFINNKKYEEGYNIDENYNYIGTPITLKLYPNEGFYLRAGTYFNVLLAKNDVYKTRSSEDNKSELLTIQNQNESTQKLDLGVNFGFGYEFEIRGNEDLRLRLGLLRNIGLLNSYKNKQEIETESNNDDDKPKVLKHRTNVFEVGIIYSFGE